MADREKCIKGLEICVNREPGKYTCNECPYEIDGNYCEINLAKDALYLLKNQERRKGSWDYGTQCDEDADVYDYCPNCGARMTNRR